MYIKLTRDLKTTVVYELNKLYLFAYFCFWLLKKQLRDNATFLTQALLR